MKRLIIFSLLVTALPTFAWDVDFHFNLTYIIARDLGFSDQTAKIAASRSAWTDASWLSGPFLLSKSREMNHFNGIKQQGSFDQTSGSGIAALVKLDIAHISQPSSPMADALFMDALKNGDLESAFGHGHSIQDKRPHSEFYGKLGHPTEGHWPDRYWNTPEKFEGSVKDTYRYLFAIRQLLPPEALDFSHADTFAKDPKPSDLNDPDLLAARFLSHPEVIKAQHTDFLKDSRYVKLAVASFIDGMKAKGFVGSEITTEFLLPEGLRIDGSADFYDVMKKIIVEDQFMADNNGRPLFTKQIIPAVFPEFRSFTEAYEHYHRDAIQLIKNDPSAANLTPAQLEATAAQAARDEMAERVTNYLAVGSVPRNLDAHQRWVGMFEDDTLRRFELSIRTDTWNEISKAHNGHKVGYKSLSLLATPVLSRILRNVPGLSKELFNEHHSTRSDDSEVEFVKVNSSGRMNWVRRQWRAILLKPWNTLHSPAFLQGAYDYQDTAKLQAMVAKGEIKRFSKSEIDLMSKDSPSLVERALTTVKAWLERLDKGGLTTVDQDSLENLDRDGVVDPAKAASGPAPDCVSHFR